MPKISEYEIENNIKGVKASWNILLYMLHYEYNIRRITRPWALYYYVYNNACNFIIAIVKLWNIMSWYYICLAPVCIWPLYENSNGNKVMKHNRGVWSSYDNRYMMTTDSVRLWEGTYHRVSKSRKASPMRILTFLCSYCGEIWIYEMIFPAIQYLIYSMRSCQQ